MDKRYRIDEIRAQLNLDPLESQGWRVGVLVVSVVLAAVGAMFALLGIMVILARRIGPEYTFLLIGSLLAAGGGLVAWKLRR